MTDDEFAPKKLTVLVVLIGQSGSIMLVGIDSSYGHPKRIAYRCSVMISAYSGQRRYLLVSCDTAML
jgi:hypothetical protein